MELRKKQATFMDQHLEIKQEMAGNSTDSRMLKE